ncbi:MAG: DUF373 family protein [Methanotrichaceae archaeon]|nr:DUF373 family protein [Methanotrichaceae archaeon]
MDVLVLCIDRDNDLGRKAGINGSVIGREANIQAALKLGISDPEDSDTNTIFGGIKAFDEFVATGTIAEIATISGDVNVGLTSDNKLADQLDMLLQRFQPSSVIVVSDGAEDEAILPIIQSRIKVNGVRRVLVKQSHNLESTYYLLKQIFTEPKISHTVFIVPGLALLMFAIFGIIRYPEGAWIAMTGSIGLYLLFRGLGLDDSMQSAKQTMRESLYAGKIAFITYILAGMLIIIATIQGAASISQLYWSPIWYGYLTLALVFLHDTIWWYVAAAISINMGKIMDMYLEGKTDAKTYSYPFFIFATGLVIWSATGFMLASNADLKFSIGIFQSLQYLAVSAVLAVLITLAGVNVSKRIASDTAAK